MDQKLQGKVAVVTGGARGLGRGYALRMANLGADIAIVDRNLSAGDVYEFESNLKTAQSVAEECRAIGVRAIELEADLTDRDGTFATMDTVAKELGAIDIAVCNAGGGTVAFADELEQGEGDEPVLDQNTTGTAAVCDEETLQRVMAINLSTCMYTCMAVAPHMIERNAGKIVTVSSVAGLEAGRGYHPYGMAKAAIIHYTRSLAQELGPHNINVNCIAPGIIRTGRLGDREHLSKYIALRREGTIEDCAKVVEFLVTDLSDYVTGKTITIDGGQCNQR
jgi:3-oxoacyl-[acyl-carrier protein] reductase